MRWTTATLALLGFLALCTADDKTDPKVQPVRELIVKDLKIGKVKAKLDEPAKVTNAEELAKLVADKDEAAKIAKEIDFAKEYLIVFAWEGSGQDRLDHAIKAEKDDPVPYLTLIALWREFCRIAIHWGDGFDTENLANARSGSEA